MKLGSPTKLTHPHCSISGCPCSPSLPPCVQHQLMSRGATLGSLSEPVGAHCSSSSHTYICLSFPLCSTTFSAPNLGLSRSMMWLFHRNWTSVTSPTSSRASSNNSYVLPGIKAPLEHQTPSQGQPAHFSTITCKHSFICCRSQRYASRSPGDSQQTL